MLQFGYNTGVINAPQQVNCSFIQLNHGKKKAIEYNTEEKLSIVILHYTIGEAIPI